MIDWYSAAKAVEEASVFSTRESGLLRLIEWLTISSELDKAMVKSIVRGQALTSGMHLAVIFAVLLARAWSRSDQKVVLIR